MFSNDSAEKRYEKYAKWISDENFQFSPDFVPTEETPAEAIEYYKEKVSGLFPMIDFDSPEFEWPTGIGINL
ncbi:hypothetical protein ACUYFE_07985 [Olegusella massiliensis]|uniref:hypothetical protein n=1 Tax=Olegusella massiliensis TaxID=1776381 RepID=UPI0040556E61